LEFSQLFLKLKIRIAVFSGRRNPGLFNFFTIKQPKVMAKQDSNKKTVISGEFRTSPTHERPAVGFQPRFLREADVAIVSSHRDEPELGFAGLLNEADATMLKAMRWYMDERSRRCYKEGLDKDLMIKLDKIYTKYFDPTL
jgi:hypothetical protein